MVDLDRIARLGVAHVEPALIAMLERLFDDLEMPSGLDLRRLGRQLRPEELKALGYRTNLKLTTELHFLLTEQGRADPVAAAQRIVSAITSSRVHQRKVKQAREIMGPQCRIQVTENRMASGSCPACRKLAAKPVPLSQAPNGPLPECPHPDQCFLLWNTVMDWD